MNYQDNSLVSAIGFLNLVKRNAEKIAAKEENEFSTFTNIALDARDASEHLCDSLAGRAEMEEREGSFLKGKKIIDDLFSLLSSMERFWVTSDMSMLFVDLSSAKQSLEQS